MIALSQLVKALHRGLTSNSGQIFHHAGRWWTGDEIRRDIARITAVLSKQGVRPGDRILLAYGNSYAYITLYCALLTYGVAIVPANPAMPGPELAGLVKRANPIGAWIPTGLDEVAQVCSDADLRFVIAVDDTLEDLRSQTAVGDADAHETTIDGGGLDASDDAPAVLMFTSGTTGTPKGVLLTHRQLLTTAQEVIKSHGLTAHDVTYGFLPMYHINAQVVVVLSTLLSGGKIVVGEKFSASRFWPIVEQFKITWISAVPTVIAILAKQDPAPKAPPSLRFIRSASAPLPEVHAKQFEEKYGVAVIESYGMTEAASQICVNPIPPANRKIGSVGLPQGVELRVVGDDGRQLMAGETGSIEIRGEMVIQSYESGDESGTNFRDGWFCTGDVGYMDEEGYVYLTGRTKDIINRAGQKISPREVEEVILQHPGAQSVAVIGLPDDVYGERVAAYVVADERQPTESLIEDLQALCKRSLSRYKCPAEYQLVSELPTGTNGKIQRQRLRQQVLQMAGQN